MDERGSSLPGRTRLRSAPGHRPAHRPGPATALLKPLAVLIALLLAGVLAACAGDPDTGTEQVFTPPATVEPDLAVPEATYPDEAIIVQDSLITAWRHRRFFAYSIKGDSGRIDVIATDGTSTTHKVKRGETFEADKVRFRVLDVVPNENSSGAAGGSTGRIVLMPAI